jgi:hypothetical protein
MSAAIPGPAFSELSPGYPLRSPGLHSLCRWLGTLRRNWNDGRWTRATAYWVLHFKLASAALFRYFGDTALN